MNPRLIKDILVIDFETYYDKDYTLKKLTTSTYIADPHFEVIGVGTYRPRTGEWAWMTEGAFRDWAARQDFSKTAFLAHHAHFDGFILSYHYGIKPGFWLDTLSMANGLGLNVTVGGSLAKLAEGFGVGEKGHEVILAQGKRRKDFTNEEYEAYGRYCVNDCKLTWDIYAKMEDMLPESELPVIDMTIRAFTEGAIDMDRELLSNALSDEQKRKEDLLARSGVDKAALMSNDKFAALLLERGVEPPMKVSPTTGKEAYAFAKSDPGMKDLLDSEVEEVRWLAEARLGVKSTIAESRIGRMLALPQPAPIYLKYAAAHTQRWGGGDKTNFQNLPKGGPIRAAMRAPKGYVIVACDSAGIEARGLPWISNHETLLEDFRNGVDSYLKFARVIYQTEVDHEKNEGDIARRFVAKTCVLGLGYGMGFKKLATTFLSGKVDPNPKKNTFARFTREDADAMGAPVFDIPEVRNIPTRYSYEEILPHFCVAKRLVDLYRAQNPKVKQFWQLCDHLLLRMDTAPYEGTFGPGDVFRIARHALVRPSGLALHYPGLRKDEEGWRYMGGAAGKQVSRVYGGLLTENIVQSFCRDVVAEQAVRIQEELGLQVVTTTHDEVVVRAKASEAEATAKAMVAIMRQPPKWAPGLPLNAKAGFGERYGDCK